MCSGCPLRKAIPGAVGSGFATWEVGVRFSGFAAFLHFHCLLTFEGSRRPHSFRRFLQIFQLLLWKVTLLRVVCFGRVFQQSSEDSIQHSDV